MEALVRAAKRADARRLFLEVGHSNSGAIALYKGLGFKETGRRKGYYQRSGAEPEDALDFEAPEWALERGRER